MEILDSLFGQKDKEKNVVDTNIPEVSENAEKINDEKIEAENVVVEQTLESEDLTTCEKCDLQPETCEQELGTKCTQVEVPENAKEIIIEDKKSQYTLQSFAKEILTILDCTPSTDFELITLKSRLYSMVSKVI